MLTLTFSICIVALGIAIVAGALYGMLVWFPRYQRDKVERLKATGRLGEATILRWHSLGGSHTYRSTAIKRVSVGLDMRVPGIEPFEIDKVFTLTDGSIIEKLEVGKVVAVWVDPEEPRNPDKIVMHIK